MTPKLNETMRDLIATKLELTQEEVKGAAEKAARQRKPYPATSQPAIGLNRNKLTQECAGERVCLTRERLPCQEPNTTNSLRLKPTKCQMITVRMWKLFFLRKQKYFNESLDIWKQLLAFFFFFFF